MCFISMPTKIIEKLMRWSDFGYPFPLSQDLEYGIRVECESFVRRMSE